MTESPQNRPEANESACRADSVCSGVSLHLCVWAYGGPFQPLSALALDREPEIASVIRDIIRNGAGTHPEQSADFFSARFANALDATSTAKALQQRFLKYRRKAEPKQIIPSILICRAPNAEVAGFNHQSGAALNDILAKENSGQILVAHPVYESIKSDPGLHFNSTPVRGTDPAPESLYELLWTDESTYGHLRQAVLTRHTVGRYEIQQELGRGAMAAVYKAHDQVIGRTVALKIISLDLNTPERQDIMERLQREAQAAGKLDHSNIITVYDVGQEADVVYLSMQFLQGQTLQRYLADSGVPSLSTLMSWAGQICSAVGYAHAHGVIHRDLKPANLMLTNQGVIKVLDFGIAKIENATLTQTGLVVGTPSYMSPEQVAGKKIDHRTDIFALGSVFYELVTREKPFRGDVATILYKIVNEDPPAPSIINPALPGGIDAIIRKALAKNPNERFQNCEEMRTAFLEQAGLLNLVTPAAVPVAAAPKSEPHPGLAINVLPELTGEATPRRSRRLWPALVAALTLAVLASMTWVFYIRTGASPVAVRATNFIASTHASAVGLFDRAMKATKSSVIQSQPVDTDDPAQNASAENHDTLTNAANERQNVPSPPTPSPEPNAPVASSQGAIDAAHAPSTTAQSQPHETQQPGKPDDSEAQPHAPGPQPEKNQSTSEAGADPNASSINSGPAKLAVASSTDEAPAVTPAVATKPHPKPRREPSSIDGFTRHDVPELLREADAAAGRGDYRLAIYSYNLILKLDPGNSTAKAALRRVQAAQQSQ